MVQGGSLLPRTVRRTESRNKAGQHTEGRHTEGRSARQPEHSAIRPDTASPALKIQSAIDRANGGHPPGSRFGARADQTAPRPDRLTR